MRTLLKNRIRIYRSSIVSYADQVDTNGDITGEKLVTYSTPRISSANVISVSDKVQRQLYGITQEDDIAVLLQDYDTPLNKSDILWIYAVPPDPFDATDPHNDYAVKKIKRSLNYTVYVLGSVNIV